MANFTNKLTRQVYKKRPGTSGIRGQLYETKLLSLIYFKALHDENIEEFYLATNIDDTGIFDDICFRAKVKGFDKPVAVFIQAKHRENDKLLTLNSKRDLTNYFDSYLKIKRSFQPNNEDVLFKGTFCETECLFVMYTTAKDDGNNKHYEGSLAKYLNNLIGTGSVGSQPSYTDEDMELLSQQILEEQFITLAQKMAKYMFDDAKNQMMNDELVLRYHVILAQKVFDISEIQPKGHRIASFRQDFFGQSEKILQIFKDELCSEILERRKVDINKTRGLLTHFVSKYDDIEFLSKLIGSVIVFKNGKLEFRDKMLPEYNLRLDRVSDSLCTVRQAVELAVKESISSLEFGVPASFGNKDLAIRGENGKIEKRLDHLISKLAYLIETTTPNNIVTIDESMGDGFLRLNGGIASAVGNIFVFDQTSKLIKFCDNCDSLGNVARRFFAKLQSKIQNFQDYKFDVRVKMFPKLTLNRSNNDENIVKDFFSKLIFYTSQGDENYVEEILKDEIQNIQPYFHNVEIRSEAIFLKFHDKVQKWWVKPKEGSYLTKESDLFKKAVDSASQPLTDVIDMMNDIKYRDHCTEDEGEDAVLALPDHQHLETVLVTENSGITLAKVLRYTVSFIFFIIVIIVFWFVVSNIIRIRPLKEPATRTISHPTSANDGWHTKAVYDGEVLRISGD